MGGEGQLTPAPLPILPDKGENFRFSPFLKIFSNVRPPLRKFLTPSLCTYICIYSKTRQSKFWGCYGVIKDREILPFEKDLCVKAAIYCKRGVLRGSFSVLPFSWFISEDQLHPKESFTFYTSRDPWIIEKDLSTQK